jgi:hypothetical protein
MVDDELTGPERQQLVDFARAMVDRARQANLAPSNGEEDGLSLPFREDLDAKAVVELLSAYHRFFEKLRSQLTRELDAVLLTVERLRNGAYDHTGRGSGVAGRAPGISRSD